MHVLTLQKPRGPEVGCPACLGRGLSQTSLSPPCYSLSEGCHLHNHPACRQRSADPNTIVPSSKNNNNDDAAHPLKPKACCFSTDVLPICHSLTIGPRHPADYLGEIQRDFPSCCRCVFFVFCIWTCIVMFSLVLLGGLNSLRSFLTQPSPSTHPMKCGSSSPKLHPESLHMKPNSKDRQC